jgi:hypothetical protein
MNWLSSIGESGAGLWKAGARRAAATEERVVAGTFPLFRDGAVVSPPSGSSRWWQRPRRCDRLAQPRAELRTTSAANLACSLAA